MQHSNWNQKKNKIYIVYNADQSLSGFLLNWLNRIIFPNTYNCNLTKLTHDKFGLKKEWQDFIRSLNHETEILYRNDFLRQFPLPDPEFPTIFTYNNSLKILVDHNQINALNSLPELIKIIKEKLNLL